MPSQPSQPSLSGVWEPAQLAKAAQEDLGEDPQRLAQDIATLKAWISKSPHLKNIKKDDTTLTMFLR